LANKLTKSPIVIGGCGRSGTSILSAVLSAHPSIVVIPMETNVFCRFTKDLKGISLEDFTKQRMLPNFVKYSTRETQTRICEKTPINVFYFNEILKLYNNDIKLINIIRDGRDVLLSRHPLDSSFPFVSWKAWKSRMLDGLKYKDHPSVYTIKYEDLVLNFKETIVKLCNFLEEPVTKEILDWYKYATVRKHAAWFKPLRPLDAKSIGKWKTTEHKEQVEKFMNQKVCVELMKEYGYIK